LLLTGGDTICRKILKMIVSAVKAWMENRGPSRGAAIAFYMLFSISPILIIITSTAGFFMGYDAVRIAIVEQSRSFVGEQSAEVVNSIIQGRQAKLKSHFFTGIFGLIVMIIGSSSVFIELKDALDNIWKFEGRGKVWGVFKARLLSLAIIMAISLLVIVSILVSAVVEKIAHLGSGFINRHAFMLESLNFLSLFFMSTLLSATVYKVLPSANIEWGDVWVGASITSVLFTIGKTLIALYLLHSATASLFGAAGSLIVLLFWIYYSSQIFLLGAEFTKLYADYLDSGGRKAAKTPN